MSDKLLKDATNGHPVADPEEIKPGDYVVFVQLEGRQVVRKARKNENPRHMALASYSNDKLCVVPVAYSSI